MDIVDEETDSPEDPRREFAEECRSARELHDPKALTQQDLARLIRTSRSTISRVETCEGAIPPDLPPLLDEVFGTDGKFRRLHEAAIAASFRSVYRRRMAMERTAVTIREWSPTLVPGLFQTADYARHVFQGGYPRANAREISTSVNDRMARRALLDADTPPDVRVVLCESVLRRHFCPPEVMRRQLKALLVAGSRPTVRVQVLPLDAPAHLFIDGPVSLITSPQHNVVVCVENYRTGGILEDRELVQAALRAYDELTGDALPPRVSARLIAEQMEKLT
ncbi:helix-turn-helix domain-containing protein [Streptomyces monomycini]|uniref:helix-turn-helix domain-containing protein n=1 Tax=Streptomyces monomycini TaxID=371720 RepID=UPI0027E28600|nr:helix-turn-helix transcriptional regulator [Streptomyces monomycini]